MKVIFLLISFLHFAYASYYYEYGKKVEILDNKTQNTISNSNMEKFITKDGRNIMFKKNQIIVKCKKNRFCEDDFISINLQNFEKISTSFYLIKITNTQNIFNICKELYEKEDIQIAHPNYINNAQKR